MLVLILAVAGCASSSSSSSSSSSAQSQCSALVDAVCSRLASCLPDAGTASSCENALNPGVINCQKAQSVTSNYDACMSDISNDPCGQLFPSGQLVLPSTCDGVIQASQ